MPMTPEQKVNAYSIIAKTASMELGVATTSMNPESVRRDAAEASRTYLSLIEHPIHARWMLAHRPDLLAFWAEGCEEDIALREAVTLIANEPDVEQER